MLTLVIEDRVATPSIKPNYKEPTLNTPKQGSESSDLQSSDLKSLDDQTVLELEAAAFRRLVSHLDQNKDVQNIDLMNLASFCRNCLSKWYKAAAEDKGIALEYEEVRERIYGIPFADWKKQHQTEATPEQQKAFNEKHA
jgi:hypothetical protein